jgi:hypothetical protein
MPAGKRIWEIYTQEEGQRVIVNPRSSPITSALSSKGLSEGFAVQN